MPFKNEGQNVMDNDDAIVGRIFSRREALAHAAKAGFGLALTGGAIAATRGGDRTHDLPKVHLVASPVLTEGPFFVDEKLNRSNLIGDTTRDSVRNGIPLELKFTVYKANGDTFEPLPGAQVDVWHADGHGVYSDESNPMNHENTAHQTWLRGYQMSDSSGVVKFKTIVPGWYDGRTAHIHFKVRQRSKDGSTTAEFNSQLFFVDTLLDQLYQASPYNSRGDRTMRNDADDIYSERQVDGSVAGHHLTLLPEKQGATGGYVAHFAIALTKGNLSGARRRGFGGPGGPGGPWTPPSGGFGPFDGGFPPAKGKGTN